MCMRGISDTLLVLTLYYETFILTLQNKYTSVQESITSMKLKCCIIIIMVEKMCSVGLGNKRTSMHWKNQMYTVHHTNENDSRLLLYIADGKDV